MAKILTRGMNSIFYSMIGNLPGDKVYNKNWNVAPYMPDRDFLFIDFYPSLYNPSTPVYLNVSVNSGTPVSCKIVDALGTIYFTSKYNFGTNNFQVTDSIGNVLNNYTFIFTNLYMYYEISGNMLLNYFIELLRTKNDIYLEDVRDAQAYNNFGTFFDFPQPSDFSSDEYLNVLESLTTAFLNGGTYLGIKTAIHDITGVDPDIVPYETLSGWTVYDNPKWVYSGISWIDSDPTEDHYYADGVNTNLRAKPGIEIYSKEQKINFVQIIVYNSTRTVTNENAIKTQTNGGSDYISNQNLTPTIVTITQGLNTYTELTNFTVDRTNGIINWIPLQPQPLINTTYQVTYTYIIKNIIENICNNIKPAHIGLSFVYL